MMFGIKFIKEYDFTTLLFFNSGSVLDSATLILQVWN